MSSGRTNAASVGDSPEFVTLESSRWSVDGYVNYTATITFPKPVKQLLGLSILFTQGSVGYPQKEGYVQLEEAGGSAVRPISIEGNKVSFETAFSISFNTPFNIGACYIPE